MCAAVGVPVLLAYNVPPSATFLNQAAALVGWALVLLALVPALSGRRLVASAGSLALLAALGLSALSCVASIAWQGLPAPLGVSSLGIIAAAALTMAFGATLAPNDARAAFRALAWALLAAGLLSVVIAIVQVFAPDLADGTWIATSAFEGRASGNLRQPNHLSTLLLWAMIAAVWLGEAGIVGRTQAMAFAALLDFALVLTASRTGIVGAVILGLWGVLDRRLSRATRLMLLAAPVVYALLWLAMTAWAHGHHQTFAGESRLSAEGDISSSRFGIWSDTVHLIARHPWWGVGFGEFNFAWSLTPFPHRPIAFFDHTHNLPLQLVVEMGIPLGAGVFVLLLVALWRAFAGTRGPAGPHTTMLRAAFLMVLMVGLHSLLEYPLWYAYFLLPTAFAFGLCLAASRAGAAGPVAWRMAPAVAAVLMLAAGIAAIVDYHRVAVIFASDDARPLAERVAEGERSWLFAHHAYYAAATVAEPPSDEMPAFSVATHYLLDTRLMMAWATALAEAGDIERARHIAARLREFRNEDAKPFFAPCDEPAAADAQLPFQCTAPTRAFDYRDFR